MIADEQQDRAALYALGSLDADEVVAFESAMRNDAELRALVRELQEAASAIALSAPGNVPRVELRNRVLAAITAGAHTQSSESLRRQKIVAHPVSWLPWAIAALFFVSLGTLFYHHMRLRHEIAQIRRTDPLMQTHFVALAPAKNAPADAKAMVAWQPDKQSGVIHVKGLPAAEKGKGYQLWVVDAEHRDPINAGMVHVERDGTAKVRFRPAGAARKVKAFALSLEREGGARKRQGPILLIGNV